MFRCLEIGPHYVLTLKPSNRPTQDLSCECQIQRIKLPVCSVEWWPYFLVHEAGNRYFSVPSMKISPYGCRLDPTTTCSQTKPPCLDITIIIASFTIIYFMLRHITPTRMRHSMHLPSVLYRTIAVSRLVSFYYHATTFVS